VKFLTYHLQENSSHARHPLRKDIVSIVGEENIIEDRAALSGSYSKDASPFPSITPGIVVKPSSIEQISALMKLATAHRTLVIARGGGTSITGVSPNPHPETAIVLETRHLNRIIAIDDQNMTATVEGGIIMGDMEAQITKKGLFVHTVHVPLHFVTLGGVLSGVAGGGIPPKSCVYGNGMNFLLGLKVVLPDGRVLSTNGGSNIYQKRDFFKGSNGPDLTQLFVGDGGIFGIKVEATIRIFPESMPWDIDCSLFSDFSLVWRAYSRLTTLDPFPYCQLRVRDSGKYVLDYVVEAKDSVQIKSLFDQILYICEEEGGMRGSESDRESGRKISSMGELGSDLRTEKNVRAPRILVAFYVGNRDLPNVYSEMKNLISKQISSKRLDQIGVRMYSGFLSNMQNSTYCFFNITFDPNSDESRSGVLALAKLSYEKSVEMGCCPEPHQGYGSQVMAKAWSNEYTEMILGIKKMVDPAMILNRGLWDI
jgi:hypothetical protein